MQGRTGFLALALVLACWLPSTAAAAPMPAGTYDVAIGQGSVDLGTGLLPPITMNSGTSFTVPITGQPVAQPIGLTVANVPITGVVTGTVSVTVLGAGVTINPSDGSATLDASFFGSLTLSNGIISGNCSLGSSGSPVTVHLTTANGSTWDPATGGFSMVDKTFVTPSPSCTGLVGSLLPSLLGSTTNPGDNIISILGTALRRPDPVTSTTNTTTSQPGSTSSGVTTVPTTTTGTTGTQPATPVAAKRCVVPKLIGKTLKQAKRALTKAGCKAGKSKSKKSKKKKKGVILKQGKKAGAKLPAGAKVPLTVSRGPGKARNRSSR